MLEFAQPWALALVPLAVLAAWSWRRQRRPALRWPDVSAWTTLPAGRVRWVRIGGALLRALGVAAMTLALAGPRWPDAGSRLPVEGTAIVIALDVSGSMAERDFNWDGKLIGRLEAAQRSLHRFVLGDDGSPTRPRDRIGLVAFAAAPEDTCPLTLSHDALVQLLEAERPRRPPDTGTNIGDAIVWALHKLEAASERSGAIILVTDGEHNAAPPALTPRRAAQLAAARGVAVHTIDAGPAEAARDDPQQAAARAAARTALAEVAAITGGRSFVAHDGAALRAALHSIDELARTKAESFQYRRYHEGFPFFSAAALLCIALALGLEATIWRRTP